MCLRNPSISRWTMNQKIDFVVGHACSTYQTLPSKRIRRGLETQPENDMNNNQSGFTLVRLATVLVIIGLLLGGVLKGPELISQAKIKGVASDLGRISATI